MTECQHYGRPSSFPPDTVWQVDWAYVSWTLGTEDTRCSVSCPRFPWIQWLPWDGVRYIHSLEAHLKGWLGMSWTLASYRTMGLNLSSATWELRASGQIFIALGPPTFLFLNLEPIMPLARLFLPLTEMIHIIYYILHITWYILHIIYHILHIIRYTVHIMLHILWYIVLIYITYYMVYII